MSAIQSVHPIRRTICLCMVPAVSGQGLENNSQPLTPSATKPKGRKAIHYWVDSATLQIESGSSSPLNQVDNAVEGYELFLRPWFEAAATIYIPPPGQTLLHLLCSSYAPLLPTGESTGVPHR